MFTVVSSEHWKIDPTRAITETLPCDKRDAGSAARRQTSFSPDSTQTGVALLYPFGSITPTLSWLVIDYNQVDFLRPRRFYFCSAYTSKLM